MNRIRDKRVSIFLLIAVLASLIFAVTQGLAHPGDQAPEPVPPAQILDNAACLNCHATPGQTLALPSGESLYISVDPEVYNSSIHGSKGYACVQCHTDTTNFPHPEVTAQNRREYSIQRAQICGSCHQQPVLDTQDSIHTMALQAGNLDAAICTDCHGAHGTVPLGEPRSRIPQTCERCHSQIYALYKDSVHGAALLGEGNPDVPACTDCHGEDANPHKIQGPSETGFRLHSPDLCARCHANTELMAKYGINTDVFETYLSDFHGTTVELFQATAPGQETNKPVCIDCHGVHNMKKVDNPESQVIKQNLLSTCQRCHPNASANFPNAWLSHYRPSPQHNPIVYYVNTFYKFFIPGVLGVMGVFVLSDIYRRVTRKGKKQ